MDRIADGSTVTTVEELEAWVKEKDHPVLEMEPMQAKEQVAVAGEVVVAQAEVIVEAVEIAPEKARTDQNRSR